MTEVELKFPISGGFERLEQHLQELGFTLVADRREKNSIFDSDREKGMLRSLGALLRVRTAMSEQGGDEVYTLTVKTRKTADGVDLPSSGMKVRQEYEVELGGGAADIFAMLRSIGFVVVFEYEKTRKEYRSGGISVCLDRLDFGDFVEIEASDDESVRRTASDLGLDLRSGTALSYITLGRNAGQDGGRPAE
jgi:adenylate cyclase class 2